MTNKYLLDILFYIVIPLLVLIPTIYASIIGAPLAITNKKLIRKIIKELKIEKDNSIYELGTGTGRVTIELAKRTDKVVNGFELSPLYWLISLINIKINSINNINLHLKNFFKADLSQADIIYCFLMPKALEKLKTKFLKELKENTTIVSFGFQIKGWEYYKKIKKRAETI